MFSDGFLLCDAPLLVSVYCKMVLCLFVKTESYLCLFLSVPIKLLDTILGTITQYILEADNHSSASFFMHTTINEIKT